VRRAAHQLYDAPVVFADPIAVPILGSTYAAQLTRTPALDRPLSIALRAFVVARSRYAEDQLRRATAAGVRQYVLLGAGLDTFAYRNPYPELHVFEVDHPATQNWKRELLAESGIPIPGSLSFAPVDFERESLSAQLQAAGFETRIPAFFAWLGVVPYLTEEAFRATVGFVSAQPPGSGVVFDYVQPRAALPPLEGLAYDSVAARVESAGEPFRLSFTPDSVAAELAGFRDIEDIGSSSINARYFQQSGRLEVRGAAGRLVSAWR
jgi:methyltransferase (TIGR00027 family)